MASIDSASADGKGSLRLDRFDNSWYDPGRGVAVRSMWILVSVLFFQTAFPWPSRLKAALLQLFGASVGEDAVIKPRVTVKYPWNLSIGDYVWIGEGVWIDTLSMVEIGNNVCISQGVMIETGNHDWSDPAFGLTVDPVRLTDGSWAAAKALILPGSVLESHSVLSAGSVLAGGTEPYGIYHGNPAQRIRDREIRD